MVGLNDLKGLLQPKRLCDSVMQVILGLQKGKQQERGEREQG